MNEENLYETVYLNGRCPKCGEAVEELNRETDSGHDVRFYKCSACSWGDFVDVGVALWKALSDAKKETR